MRIRYTRNTSRETLIRRLLRRFAVRQGREVKHTMPDVVALLDPRFTDEEQVPAKQMQQGFKRFREMLRAHERVIVTSNGKAEAVMLPYQDVKVLWQLVSDLVERAENQALADLAESRLKDQRSHRVALEEGLRGMRRAMMERSDE